MYAKAEDAHFKALAQSLTSLEENNIKQTEPNHPSHYKK
jgi:uncharacterized protein YdcH (DUF465 family)